MTALQPRGRFDPALGRLPGAVAHAHLRGDDWLATASLSITTALEAAAPNTRIAWACDGAVLRTWALGRAAAWYPDERDRIRLPTRPELLVRFVTDRLGGYDGEPARARATVQRYLSTLSTLHRLLDAPDPTKAPMVRNTVKVKTRGSGGQDQAAPLRWAAAPGPANPAGRSGASPTPINSICRSKLETVVIDLGFRLHHCARSRLSPIAATGLPRQDRCPAVATR